MGNGELLGNNKNVSEINIESDKVQFIVGSGNYTFEYNE